MNAKYKFNRLLLASVILFFALSCNLPTSQSVVTPAQVITATTIQSLDLPILSPTLTPTRLFTKMPTRTPTNTPLPPLPEFDDVLTFGGGGGGGQCGVPPSLPPALEVNQFNNVLALCMWGVNFGLPFEITFYAPDGRIAGPIKLLVDRRASKVNWHGYHQDEFSFIADGTFAEIEIWWPIDYPTGQWRACAYGGGLEAGTDFTVQKNASPPYIAALDPRPWNEITPGVITDGLHMLRLKNNRRVDMLGLGYPANSTIYLLTYRKTTPTSQDFTLMTTQAAYSDFSGKVTAELQGPFDPGSSYLLVGVSDPNTRIITENNGLIQERPHDYFRILSDSGSPNSCPGAPPQRMTVNQRGYVCTRSDPVRLRTAPAKSASTLLELYPNAQFTIIGGPSCSDNWSWWNVQLDDGTTGWMSEGGDATDPYFICPLP